MPAVIRGWLHHCIAATMLPFHVGQGVENRSVMFTLAWIVTVSAARCVCALCLFCPDSLSPSLVLSLTHKHTFMIHSWHSFIVVITLSLLEQTATAMAITTRSCNWNWTCTDIILYFIMGQYFDHRLAINRSRSLNCAGCHVTLTFRETSCTDIESSQWLSCI